MYLGFDGNGNGRGKDQKERLNKNLKLLGLCATYHSIASDTFKNRLIARQINELNSKENKHNKAVITEYFKEAKQENYGTIDPLVSPLELASYTIPIECPIDSDFRKSYNHVARKIQDLLKQLNDFEDVTSTVSQYISELNSSSPGEDPKDYPNMEYLEEFLSSKDHTGEFRNFAKRMKSNSPTFISHLYRQAYKKLYQQYSTDKPISEKNKISNKIDEAFNKYGYGKPNFSLKKASLFSNKRFKSLFGVLLAASTAFGTLYKTIDLYNNPGILPNNTPLLETQEPTATPGNEIIYASTNNGNNYTKLVSIDHVCNDILQKLEDLYYYKTGEKIDLPNNIYYNNFVRKDNSFMYKVEYNGKTMYFSTKSPCTSNFQLLLDALKSTGAKVEGIYGTEFFIMDNDGRVLCSINSNGDPILPGNITEKTQDSYDMHNQKLLSEARNYLQQKGVSTGSLSDSQIIGRYLVDSPPKDLEKLSEALGLMSSVSGFKDMFLMGYGNQSYYINNYRDNIVEILNELVKTSKDSFIVYGHTDDSNKDKQNKNVSDRTIGE